MPDSGTTNEAYRDLTSYDKWLEEEGLPLITGFHINDLKDVEVAPWRRKGGAGAYINLEGTGGTNDSYVVEIPPGGNLKPEKYLFEEVIYVVSGRGATTIWNEGGAKQTFEWQPGSLFSPPLNAWRQHFNGQGDQPARLFSVTTAPLVINLFHSRDLIFNNPIVFKDRYAGDAGYFSGEGKLQPGRVWESNFIPDVASFKLQDMVKRGAGGTNINFELANNTMCAHVSEFPLGTYKKAHRHAAGAHIVLLSGEGYSILWKEGQPKVRVDWHTGSLFVPPDMWFHQHFNVGRDPARYLAVRWGSKKHRVSGVLSMAGVEDSLKSGGNQIEYEDEDPEIRKMFEAELAKRGLEPRMGPFFEKK